MDDKPWPHFFSKIFLECPNPARRAWSRQDDGGELRGRRLEDRFQRTRNVMTAQVDPIDVCEIARNVRRSRELKEIHCIACRRLASHPRTVFFGIILLPP